MKRLISAALCFGVAGQVMAYDYDSYARKVEKEIEELRSRLIRGIADDRKKALEALFSGPIEVDVFKVLPSDILEPIYHTGRAKVDSLPGSAPLNCDRLYNIYESIPSLRKEAEQLDVELISILESSDGEYTDRQWQRVLQIQDRIRVINEDMNEISSPLWQSKDRLVTYLWNVYEKEVDGVPNTLYQNFDVQQVKSVIAKDFGQVLLREGTWNDEVGSEQSELLPSIVQDFRFAGDGLIMGQRLINGFEYCVDHRVRIPSFFTIEYRDSSNKDRYDVFYINFEQGKDLVL
ncbi:hypothetical protein [Pseudobacteriovorax antillogorgiicola]|uniref:Uncharacterized protein n=1 Tax=Pseudobacteriovorax antillogorgiicola TaxID=1513793 RepID=A0A1Y6CGQ7_9BACT|nr:hypothetical protein [Pseudobacteriovorax antillogorgiicola]TCS48654.1 hypothetical protein EDD56_11776 [Pseudobacteriovorax antillogorgiicola]SMF55152.1 hypothetical protein SAMN06296036_11783 [Pseudobacteriovorax antillogorgiicola]